ARRVWRYVSTSFDYRLGATLFATSREAIRDLKGDCSEASILTAALLRAAGIPARVMLGYASPGQGVWIGHAWVEAWLGGADGGWVGVDAALREFPAGPHRVALVALSGREDMKAAATNLMLSTLNNLDIGIEGAWGGRGGAGGGGGGGTAACGKFPAGPQGAPRAPRRARKDMRGAPTTGLRSTLKNPARGTGGAGAGGGELPLVEHPAARADAR